MLLDEKARRVTSNDSIKLFSSVGDKPENIGRAVLTYPAFASKTQVALSLSLSLFLSRVATVAVIYYSSCIAWIGCRQSATVLAH